MDEQGMDWPCSRFHYAEGGVRVLALLLKPITVPVGAGVYMNIANDFRFLHKHVLSDQCSCAKVSLGLHVSLQGIPRFPNISIIVITAHTY